MNTKLAAIDSVIPSDGSMSGYRWGMDRKLRLLAAELGGNVPR
jgi:hypothetical protein